jgi:hypothetical protein
MLIAGLVLGSLAGLELAAREHFAGYRSHSSLLAACAAFATGALVVIALPGPVNEAPMAIVAAAVIGVFALALWLLRWPSSDSGGLGFRWAPADRRRAGRPQAVLRRRSAAEARWAGSSDEGSSRPAGATASTAARTLR